MQFQKLLLFQIVSSCSCADCLELVTKTRACFINFQWFRLLLLLHRLSTSWNPLLGRTRSRGRCWAAIQLSHRPAPSGHAVHGLRRRAFPPVGQVSAEWSRYPGSMARRARDSVAPLRRSSAGWMPARSRRLSARCRTQASSQNTIRKASLMVGSMRRVWALRHQTGGKYSAAEWTRARVAVRNVVAPAHQPEPASRLMSTTRDAELLAKWLKVSSIHGRPVQRYTKVYMGSEQKDRVSLLWLTFTSR